MKKLLLIILCISCLYTSYAQTDTADVEDDIVPQITYLKFTGMSGAKFSLLDDNKLFILKRKLSDKDMLALLEGNDKALKHYKRYKTLNIFKRTSRWITVGSMVTGVGMAIYGENMGNETWSNAGAYTFVAGCGTFFIAYIPVMTVSASQARRTRDEYNQKMYKLEKMYSLVFGANEKGIGLFMRF